VAVHLSMRWECGSVRTCRVSVQGGRTGRQREERRVAGGAVRFGALLGGSVES
jgi:hypothetical protein